MSSVNRVTLSGNLTRDPELKFIASGSAVANLGLATNRIYRTKDGEKKEEVCYVDITVWGKSGEACAKYLHKGSAVIIEGRLKYDTWEQDDGKKRSKLTVVAVNVEFMDKKSKSTNSDKDDDDIPF